MDAFDQRALRRATNLRRLLPQCTAARMATVASPSIERRLCKDPVPSILYGCLYTSFAVVAFYISMAPKHWVTYASGCRPCEWHAECGSAEAKSSVIVGWWSPGMMRVTRHTKHIHVQSGRRIRLQGIGRCTGHINPFNASCSKLLLFRRIKRHTGLTHHFNFLTLGRSGAQSWAPERPNVKKLKWWVRPVWQSVKP